MSAFVPSKGDLFYIRLKPYRRVIGDDPLGWFFGVAQKPQIVEQQDNSYSDEIFECTGRDDHAVVGVTKHGAAYRGDRPVTFVRDRSIFAPVGPEVAAALGLTAAANG